MRILISGECMELVLRMAVQGDWNLLSRQVRHRRYYLRETRSNLRGQYRLTDDQLDLLIPEPLPRRRRRTFRNKCGN